MFDKHPCFVQLSWPVSRYSIVRSKTIFFRNISLFLPPSQADVHCCCSLVYPMKVIRQFIGFLSYTLKGGSGLVCVYLSVLVCVPLWVVAYICASVCMFTVCTCLPGECTATHKGINKIYAPFFLLCFQYV